MINYQGIQTTLKKTKGSVYIAALIREPERSFDPFQLEATAGLVEQPQASETTLDHSGLQKIHQRLEDLRDEIQEAQDHHDEATLKRLESEWTDTQDALKKELGLSGRSRRIPDAWTKAKARVLRAINRCLEEVQTAHPGLFEHLRQSIDKAEGVWTYSPRQPTIWKT